MSNRNKPRIDRKALGRRIRDLRGNLRQQEFSRQLGLSQGQLSKIERGQIAPALETVFALAIRFQKTTDWIVRGEDTKI
jgi:transcriptional regulator with XRE-family HTH domain